MPHNINDFLTASKILLLLPVQILQKIVKTVKSHRIFLLELSPGEREYLHNYLQLQGITQRNPNSLSSWHHCRRKKTKEGTWVFQMSSKKTKEFTEGAYVKKEKRYLEEMRPRLSNTPILNPTPNSQPRQWRNQLWKLQQLLINQIPWKFEIQRALFTPLLKWFRTKIDDRLAEKQFLHFSFHS